MPEHFLFKRETTFGTWATPDTQLPVRSANIQGSMPLMATEETGGGRGMIPGAIGEVGVGGPVLTTLHPTIIGKILRGSFKDITAVTVATSPGNLFRNQMLSDDSVAFDSFSAQEVYKATLGQSFKGLKLGGFQITANTREYATINMDFVGKDMTISTNPATGFWTDGITPAPAVVDPIPALPASLPDSFKFYQGVMSLGGSVAFGSGSYANEILYTGGTQRVDFDNISLNCAFGLSEDAYGVNLGDRTRQAIPEGSREITVSFAPNFDTVGAEFFNAWKAGTPAIIEMRFVGAAYETAGGAAKTISGSTQANPIVFTTSASHGLVPGDYVTIASHSITAVNKTWKVESAPSATTFTINYDNSGGSAGTSGTATEDPKKYEMVIVLPYVQYSSAGLPEVNRTYGLKRTTVEGMAKVSPTLGYDLGLVIQTTEDLTA